MGQASLMVNQAQCARVGETMKRIKWTLVQLGTPPFGVRYVCEGWSLRPRKVSPTTLAWGVYHGENILAWYGSLEVAKGAARKAILENTQSEDPCA